MALIERSDLKYDYSWDEKPGHNPKFEGTPGNTPFNQDEGRDVLYIINEYAKEEDISDEAYATKLETYIRARRPDNVGTHREVLDWLKKTFNNDKSNGSN